MNPNLYSESWVIDEAAEKLRELAEELGEGRYFVKRGWINWASFMFDHHGRGLSIQMDQATLFPQQGANPACGFHFARFSLEMAAKLEDHSTNPGIDDGIQHEMTNLGRRMFGELSTAKRDDGSPLVAMVLTDGASVQEFHSADDRVQGVVLTVTLYL